MKTMKTMKQIRDERLLHGAVEARLNQAAPQLLVACEAARHLIGGLDEHPYHDAVLCKLDAAITAAKGEQ